MNVKRCSGYRGHWECGEDYPDHMVPVSEFAQRLNGLQTFCRRCQKYGVSFYNAKISSSIKLVGSVEKLRAMTRKQRSEIFALVESTNNAVVDITPRFKSEYGPSNPMTKRETVHVEGEVVPQGWVYVIRNTETPWLFKIGKTYPDGIQSRLSEARRWGCFKLEEKYWFEDALKAEKEVHALLREHNMRNLGFEDCGTELFKCWNIGIITDAINKIQSGNDSPSIANAS